MYIFFIIMLLVIATCVATLFLVTLFTWIVPKNFSRIHIGEGELLVRSPLLRALWLIFILLPPVLLYYLLSYDMWRDTRVVFCFLIESVIFICIVWDFMNKKDPTCPKLKIDSEQLVFYHGTISKIKLADIRAFTVNTRGILPHISITGVWREQSWILNNERVRGKFYEKKFSLYLFGAPEIDVEYQLDRLIGYSARS